ADGQQSVRRRRRRSADRRGSGGEAPEARPGDRRRDLPRGRAQRRRGRVRRARADAHLRRGPRRRQLHHGSIGAVRRPRQMRGTHEMLPKTQGQRRDEVQVRRRVPGEQVDHRRKRKKQEEAGPRFPQRRGRQARQDHVRDGAPPGVRHRGQLAHERLRGRAPKVQDDFERARLRQRQVREAAVSSGRRHADSSSSPPRDALTAPPLPTPPYRLLPLDSSRRVYVSFTRYPM
ncbi:unnamed protein product, partial [Pelagomonas calceolata]